MKNKITQTSKGFTLIELVIAVAIVAIIAAIGIPAYDRYKLKGYRMDAISYLTKAAALEENWMAEKGVYTAILTNLGGDTTDRDHYTVTATGGNTFLITATAKASQTADTDCAVFTIDNVGRKLAQRSDASDNSSTCWGT